MSNLKVIYGPNIPYPTKFLRSKWFSDPFCYGGYSFCGIYGESSDFSRFCDNVKGKVFFAGEHTSRDFRGSIHGAYLSGIRVAKAMGNLK